MPDMGLQTTKGSRLQSRYTGSDAKNEDGLAKKLSDSTSGGMLNGSTTEEKLSGEYAGTNLSGHQRYATGTAPADASHKTKLGSTGESVIESLTGQATSEELLVCSGLSDKPRMMVAGSLTDSIFPNNERIARQTDVVKDKDPDYVGYSGLEGGVEVIRLNADVTGPYYKQDHEKGKLSAGIGSIDLEATLLQVKEEQNIGELLKVKGQVTIASINGNAKMEANAEYKGLSSKLSATASAGAEAVAVEGRLEGTLTITPKTVGDQIVELYNDNIDPIVDQIAGRDIPDLPAVPDVLDHGFVMGGHLEGGVGASAKASGGIEINKGIKLSGAVKFGAPLFSGMGVTFGVK